MKTHAGWVGVGLLVAFALFFQILLVHVGVSLDEALTYLDVAPQLGTQTLQNFLASEAHPPLYFLFMRVWVEIFGTSELALRIPSECFSLALIPVTYLIARRFLATGFALCATAIVPLSYPFAILAIDARPYTLSMLLATLLIYHSVRFVESGKRSDLIFVTVWTILGAYTYYINVFLSVALVISFFLYRKYLPGRSIPFIGANLVAALAFVPWLPMCLAQMHAGEPWEQKLPLLARFGEITNYVVYSLSFVSDSKLALLLAQILALVFGYSGIVLLIALSFVIDYKQKEKNVTRVSIALLEKIFNRSNANYKLLQTDAHYKFFVIFACTYAISITAIAMLGYDKSRYVAPLAPLASILLFVILSHTLPRREQLIQRVACVMLVVWAIGTYNGLRDFATLPKSGFRALAQEANRLSTTARNQTAYYGLPGGFSASFAYYKNPNIRFYGFPAWEHPEQLRIANIVTEWNAPTATSQTLDKITQLKESGVKRLVVLMRREPGHIPTVRVGELEAGKLATIYAEIARRYPRMSVEHAPGSQENIWASTFRLAQ